MLKSAALLLTASVAIALAACGGRNDAAATIPTSALAPAVSSAAQPVAGVFPAKTIGEELPSEGVGTHVDPTWGKVGGFTQSGKAQVLAFAPNTKITVENLSKSIPHTFNWVATVTKPPAHFPSNPSLSFSPHGGGIFGAHFASGQLNPGKKITVTLAHPGQYLIGCAFHYSEGMQDVLRVVAGATPGPAMTFVLH